MTFNLELTQFDPFLRVDFEEQASKLYEIQLNQESRLHSFSQLAHVPSQPYSFFPAVFFTGDPILLSDKNASVVFSSSGTSGLATARHFVADPEIYEKSILKGLESAFPGLQERKPVILALLPSYLERSDSSLVYMVRIWMEKFGHPESDFFLNDFEQLNLNLQKFIKKEEQILIIGVTYALLDFFEEYPMILPKDTILIETGGMKGRKNEMLRSVVHKQLMERTGLPSIASEYGMTELLSQAYSQANGRFYFPYWMKVEIRDLNDVNLSVPLGKAGRICIVDLANKWSCAFIATGDIGRGFADGSFEVLGRADTAGSRGCSLLYTG